MLRIRPTAALAGLISAVALLAGACSCPAAGPADPCTTVAGPAAARSAVEPPVL